MSRVPPPVEEAIAAWSAASNRLVASTDLIDRATQDMFTTTVVRWQMSLKDGKGFEYEDRALEARLRELAKLPIPKVRLPIPWGMPAPYSLLASPPGLYAWSP